MKVLDFEAQLEICGSFGFAQILVIFLAGYLEALHGWLTFAPVFLARNIQFRCKNDNFVASFFINSTIGTEIFHESKNDSLFEEVLKSFGPVDVCIKDCKEYVYESSSSSIMSEFDLACGYRSFLKAFSTSSFWFGFFLSCIFVAPFSDKFGRKTSAAFLLICQAITTTLTIFSPNIYFYILFRTLSGFLVIGTSKIFVLAMELVGKRWAASTGTIVQLFQCFGEIFCALSGEILFESWRKQALAIAVMALICVPFFLVLVPESPRWLISQGRLNDAEKHLKWMAKLNCKDASLLNLQVSNGLQPLNKKIICASSSEKGDKTINETSSLLEKEPNKKSFRKKDSLFSLFATKYSAIFTISTAFCCLAINLICHGIRYAVQGISGDLVVNTCLLALTTIPGVLFIFVVEYFGRKYTLAFLFLLSAICSFIVPLIPYSSLGGNILIIFTMTDRCFAQAAITLFYVYASEVFPTTLRSTGLSFCIAVSRFGPFLAPFINELKLGSNNLIGFFVFGACGVLGSLVLMIFGVETKGKNLISTVEQYHYRSKFKTDQ